MSGEKPSGPSPESPCIRKAQLDDAKGLASCIDAAYSQYTPRITDLPPVSDGCAEEIAKNQVWVVLSGDQVIGGLFLVPHDGYMKLANVAVHPDHGGMGLGRKLMALSEREARQQGYGEMRLNTHVEMPENVLFYVRLGWEETARTGNTVSMRKQLGPN